MKDKLLKINYEVQFTSFYPHTQKKDTYKLTEIQEKVLDKIQPYESEFNYKNNQLNLEIIIEKGKNTITEIDDYLEEILTQSKTQHNKILKNTETILKENYQMELYARTLGELLSKYKIEVK